MTTTRPGAPLPRRIVPGVRVARGILVVGIVATTAALVVMIVYVFQPWRTCPYDDSPAACAMLPGDAAVMMTAMAAFPVAAAITVAGALLLWRAKGSPRT